MVYVEHRFVLDVQKDVSQVCIPVKLCDTARRLYVSLVDGGVPYKIEEGVVASLYATNSAGESYIGDCTISGNTIIYTFDGAISAVLGIVDCDIRLYGGNDLILTAPTFFIKVGKRNEEGDEVDAEIKSATDVIYNAIANEAVARNAEDERIWRAINSIPSSGGGSSSGESSGSGGTGTDGITPRLRINASTNMWEVSYDNGGSWTSLGVKATGADGEDGEDGVTPQLRINASTNYWEVSYDNGSSWTSLGVKATGEGGGVPVVIVQTTGTSTTAVMSQKAVTDEIDALKRKDVLQDQAIADIKRSGSSFPSYNSTGMRTLVFYRLDGSGSLEVPLDQGGGGGGGASDPTVYMLSDSNPNFIIHDQGDGIYKARVLIYTAVPVCASSLEDYYYCTNMLTVLLENGMTLNKVCISNNLLHSNGSIYNNGIQKYHWDINLPLPLGDEMTFGYNDTGYYLRPNLMSGSPHVSTYWSSDWYVEMELDVNQGLLIIKAYQCKRITGIS